MTRRSTSALVAGVLSSLLGCVLGTPDSAEPGAEAGPAISSVDLAAHVRALTDDQTEGRRAGTPGEGIASDYLARAMRRIGLEPAGTDGDYRHAFDFTAGISLGPDNELVLQLAKEDRSDDIESGGGDPEDLDVEATQKLEVGTDWRPLAFSASGEIPLRPVVFAGYGLVAPAEGDAAALDDFADLEIADNWVIVFRGLPPSIEGPRRQQLQLHASLRYKAMVARDLGARGILFVSGPLGKFRSELVPLRFDASLAGTRIAVVSISDALAARLLSRTNLEFEALQRNVGTSAGLPATPHSAPRTFKVENVQLAGHIDLETRHAKGYNVLGWLQVGDEASDETIVLGAHYDHLGRGEGSSSLASGTEIGKIHPGADDNASGVAVLLEIAEQFVQRRDRDLSLGTRDFVFAAWSGEELGLLGSSAWIEDQRDAHTKNPGVVAYLNFDMVGRLGEKLIVQGLGSSPEWEALLTAAAKPLGLTISMQQDSYLPTDTTSFYTQGIPVLSAFTGVHSEYHSPRDTIDRLNLAGAAKIGELMSRVALALSHSSDPLVYQAQQAPSTRQARSGFRVFLGTVPDYAQGDVVGVRLTGVAPSGPAEVSGIRRGDIIVEVDGTPIENLYDYTYALEALRVGETAQIVVLRDGDRILHEVVPTSRD